MSAAFPDDIERADEAWIIRRDSVPGAFRRHGRAGVADSETDVGPRRQIAERVCALSIELDVGSFDPQSAPFRHNGSGVQGEPEKQVFDVFAVRLNPAQRRRRGRHQVNILADRPL